MDGKGVANVNYEHAVDNVQPFRSTILVITDRLKSLNAALQSRRLSLMCVVCIW